MVKKKRKKKRKKQNDYVQNEYKKESFISILLDNSIVFFIILFIIGWVYVIVWMNTSYYDHSQSLFNQPNLLLAFVPPWIAGFCYILYDKTNPQDYFGGTILSHVIAALFVSLFFVLTVFAIMLIGFILFGLVAVILGFGR